jgi:hypothetical protein
MRVVTTLLFALVLTSFAAANPVEYWPKLGLEFDDDGIPDDDITTVINATPFTTVSAYLALYCQDSPGREFTTVSFRLSQPVAECPGVIATRSYTNLLPGNLMIGDPFDSTGATVASTECMTSPMVYIGRIDMFYLGGACKLQILDHADYHRWVVDCQEPGIVTYYCVATNASIGTDDVWPGDVDCFPVCYVTPVEDVSWGAIKSMYR